MINPFYRHQVLNNPKNTGISDAPVSEKDNYHIKCHDCGMFLKKDRWVKKDDPNKAHGLCADCFSKYDDPMCL